MHGEPHNPGAGGWPTIRYYNKETGLNGASYVKKTSMSMCDELGPDHDYMMDYVEEAGKTSLCSLDAMDNCDERSLQFLQKVQNQDRTSWETQLSRLVGLLEKGNMKAELKDWIVKRKKIFQSLLAADSGSKNNDVKSEL